MASTITDHIVKHYYGSKASYDASDYAYGVYFATDTKEIILNGTVYGGGDISNIEWNADSDSLVFTLANGETVSVSVPTATDEADGLMSAEDKAKLDEIISTIYTGTGAISVTDGVVSLVIEEEEKVLSQSDSGLKTTLGVNYDSDTKMVQLTGIDGTVVSQFDATEFIYDGIIKDVDLVNENPETGKTGEFIKITFYTKPDESGEMGTQDIYLDVTDLTDVYIAGNGITIEAGSEGAYTVSVNVSPDSEGFLTVDENGLVLSGVQDAIDAAVAEVEKETDAAHTVLTTDDSALHLTLSSETGTNGETIYTLGEDNIASASDLSSLSDKIDTNTTDIAANASDIADNASAIETLKDEVAALEATSIEVVGDDGHISVESSTADSKTTYTVKGSDIASAEFVGTFVDTSYKGTVCAAVEGIANSLMWIEVD